MSSLPRPADKATTAKAQAAAYLTHGRFHRRFTLPATRDHEQLILSYADAGREQNQGSDVPAVLFMPGMFASRYSVLWMHAIADKLGVRVIVVDRFGMGHSTDVPLEKRMSTWIELVPALLEHLSIKHVALVSHSAGALYLMNTLFRHRNVLHPERPFAAMLAPWVDPSCSGVAGMQILQWIPVPAFGIWNRIPQFINTRIGPSLASSGAVFAQTSKMPSTLSSAINASAEEVNRRRIEEVYGHSRDMQAELDKLFPKLMFDENTVGANSEALLCLKKGPSDMWGVCENYSTFVTTFASQERSRNEQAKIKIRVYFAEKDSMIGTKGQKYFEDCWRGTEDTLDFEASTIKSTDHESVFRSVEVLEAMFLQAGGYR